MAEQRTSQGEGAWDLLIRHAEHFYRLPTFDESERNYKLRLAETLRGALQRLANIDDDEGQRQFKRAMQASDQNIVRWQDCGPFLDWYRDNLPKSHMAMAQIIDTSKPVGDRVREFLAELPLTVVKSSASRTTLASLLLFAVEPQMWPLFRASAFQWAYDRAGYPAEPSDGDEATRYGYATRFCDTFLSEAAKRGLNLRDRLDVQGVIWFMAKADKQPVGMADHDWGEFAEYHGRISIDSVGGSGGVVPIGGPRTYRLHAEHPGARHSYVSPGATGNVVWPTPLFVGAPPPTMTIASTDVAVPGHTLHFKSRSEANGRYTYVVPGLAGSVIFFPSQMPQMSGDIAPRLLVTSAVLKGAEPEAGVGAAMFSWIAIHQEVAAKLVTMGDVQAEMLATLRAMQEQGLNVISLGDKGASGPMPLDEIDPFTFLASFNRPIKDSSRQENWRFVKARWGLAAPVPTDFEGIPVAHPMAAWFLPYAEERDRRHVSLLWDLARQAVGESPAIDPKTFDACVELAQCTVPKLTMGLFWLNPTRLLAADRRNREYGEYLGVFEKPIDFESYTRWVTAIRAASDLDIPAISRAAYLWDKSRDSSAGTGSSGQRRYWVLAPGRNADHWPEFQEKGICAIDYSELRDLRTYETRDAMRAGLMVDGDTGESKKNHTLAVWQFLKEMQKGDVIFAKQGNTRMVACGTVTGDYDYDGTRSGFRHFRTVEWTSIGPWDLPNGLRFALKTLTDVTQYPDFVRALLEVIHGVAVVPPPPPPPPGDETEYSAEDALEEVFVSTEQFNEMLLALREKKNVVLQGAPGVGKTFVARRLAYALIGAKDERRVEMIQFHQSYSYEDFVQGFRPTASGQFALRSGVFYQFCRRAQLDEAVGRPYVFIIDEINRGNLSKILGELMMLIEADKRGPGFAIRLTYAETDDDRFYVPSNVHIIGTMNTADRSLALVDYALRRRFRFATLRPAFKQESFQSHLRDCGVPPALIGRIVNRMGSLNEQIAANTKDLGAGYEIGHSYFCPVPGIEPDESWFRRVILSEIAPLLEEYWFEDEEQARRRREDLLE